MGFNPFAEGMLVFEDSRFNGAEVLVTLDFPGEDHYKLFTEPPLIPPDEMDHILALERELQRMKDAGDTYSAEYEMTLTEMQDEISPTKLTARGNLALWRRFGEKVLISWNLTDAQERPMPADAEGMTRIPPSLATKIVEEWGKAVWNAATPLSGSSRNGHPSNRAMRRQKSPTT